MYLSVKNKQTVLLWLVVVAYAGLFLPLRISNVLLIVLILYSVLVTHPREIIRTVRDNLLLKLLLFFFLIHLIALAYSSNVDRGLFVIEKKIWLMALPLLLAPTIRRMHNLNAPYWLGAVSLLSSCILLIIASYRHIVLEYPAAFDFITGNEFKGFTPIHYVYYSMYFICGTLFFVNSIFDRVVKKPYGWLLILALLTYSLGIIFLVASKMAIAIYGLVTIIFLHYKIRRKRLFTISIIALLALTAIFFYFNEATRSRFEGLDTDLAILKEDVLPERVDFTGLNLRLLFWKLNIKHLWEDEKVLVGTGTGDVQDYIDEIYKRDEYKLYGYIGWDSHNQWVYTLVMLGVLGIFSLASLYYFSLSTAVRSGNLNLMIFLIVTFGFSLTESILELNKGIVFFAFVFTLLTAPLTKAEK